MRIPEKKDGVDPSVTALEGGVGGLDGIMSNGMNAATEMPDTICTTMGNLSRPVTKFGIMNIPRIAP